MQSLDLFPTTIWAEKLDLDNKKILEHIHEFKKVTEGAEFSNVGGWQGHKFENDELVNAIRDNVPWNPNSQHYNVNDPFPRGLVVHSWVNINGKGAYNLRHNHVDTQVLICGVYYVKVPENSGSIRFYDPRGHMVTAFPDSTYYYDGIQFQTIDPEEGMILYFPHWLEHEVTANPTDEDRVSVSFNILW